MKHYFNTEQITISSEGRVFLNDAELEGLELDFNVKTAGGANTECVNNIYCVNTSNASCFNSAWACGGAHNTGECN